MNTLSLKKVVAIKIVGYTNINLLGKRQSLKIYKTKATCKIAAVKMMTKIKIKGAKQFVNDIASCIKGEGLKLKVEAAKKVLRLYRWTFERYCSLLTAFRNVRLFNNSVCFELRVKL